MLSETNYLFAISIVYTNASQIDQTYTAFPEVVWAANRNYPVVNPTLEFTSEGDLVLKDWMVLWHGPQMSHPKCYTDEE